MEYRIICLIIKKIEKAVGHIFNNPNFDSQISYKRSKKGHKELFTFIYGESQ